jgi:5-methyltetrahydrofolate--homocysteine methyltransferase
MNKETFNKIIKDRLLFLDGATGTELAKKGMPKGVCPEEWILDNPDSIIEIQKGYIEAGSDIVSPFCFDNTPGTWCRCNWMQLFNRSRRYAEDH